MPIKDRDYRRYCAARRNAKQRGIPFMLTFGEWLFAWHASGHYAEMGKRAGQYVMARYGDVGGYTVGNVKIITAEQNHREQNQNPVTRARQVAKAKAQAVARRIERCGASLSGRPSIALDDAPLGLAPLYGGERGSTPWGGTTCKYPNDPDCPNMPDCPYCVAGRPRCAF